MKYGMKFSKDLQFTRSPLAQGVACSYTGKQARCTVVDSGILQYIGTPEPVCDELVIDIATTLGITKKYVEELTIGDLILPKGGGNYTHAQLKDRDESHRH